MNEGCDQIRSEVGGKIEQRRVVTSCEENIGKEIVIF